MMSERKRILLLGIVKKRSPQSLHVAESFLAGSQLPPSEIELLVHLINDEFMAEGINPDYSPTQCGHELEALLDDVNRGRSA